MSPYDEIEKELQEHFPKLFDTIDPVYWSLLANSMHEFLDNDSDAYNYCSFIDVYTNKHDAIASHIKCVNKYCAAYMKTISEKHNIYLVYAIDP